MSFIIPVDLGDCTPREILLACGQILVSENDTETIRPDKVRKVEESVRAALADFPKAELSLSVISILQQVLADVVKTQKMMKAGSA